MSQLVEFPRMRTHQYRLSPQVIEGLMYAVPLSTMLWIALILVAANLL